MLMGKFPGWYLAYDKYNATHKVRILSMAAMSKMFWFSRINCVADFPTCGTTAIEEERKANRNLAANPRFFYNEDYYTSLAL